MKTITIAIDAMGGDHGPSVVVPACLKIIAKYPFLQLILVGDNELLQKQLKSAASCERIKIQHASQQVAMDESPAQALRTKKDSSMRVAINLVKNGQAEACVSAGNTGALMATARFVLKTLPGIDRPAIISTFPTKVNHKSMRMLDLGANVDSNAEHLLQFAVMGSILTSAVDNIKNPQIYLLNIGHEDIKGNELVKQTAQLLATSNLVSYAGYIEGDQIYDGQADVIVCDGFVGNVALKTSEGVAIFIGKLLKDAFKRNWFTKLSALISWPVLKSLIKHIDPDRYNGASFIGLPKTVIKSHGGANVNAFGYAIEEAIIQVEKNIPQLISTQIEQLLKLPTDKKIDSEGDMQ